MHDREELHADRAMQEATHHPNQRTRRDASQLLLISSKTGVPRKMAGHSVGLWGTQNTDSTEPGTGLSGALRLL